MNRADLGSSSLLVGDRRGIVEIGIPTEAEALNFVLLGE